MAKKIKTGKTLEEETVDCTILEASERWPDSKACAFQIGGQPLTTYYFLVDKPKFNPHPEQYRSLNKCLKFDSNDGYLVITNLKIYNETIINPITIKEFTDKVLETMETIIQHGTENQLTPYKIHGFFKEPPPLTVVK